MSTFSELIAEFGIASHEITPSVAAALAAMLEKLDAQSRELRKAQKELLEIQELIDFQGPVPLPNRRAFLKKIAWAIAMNERHGTFSSVVSVAISNMAEIERVYGYEVRDKVRSYVVAVITERLRDTDFFGRLGPDEYGIVMFSANLEQAQEKASYLAYKVEETPYFWNGKKIQVKMAAGAHLIRKADDPEGSLSAANTAMYVDKVRREKGMEA